MVYVEVFGGGGSVLLNKERSVREVLNDANGNLINLYRVVREHPDELKDHLLYVLHSREDFKIAQRRLAQFSYKDDILRAADFYQVVRQSYAGNGKQFSAVARSMWAGFPAIDRVAGRLQGLSLIHISQLLGGEFPVCHQHLLENSTPAQKILVLLGPFQLFGESRGKALVLWGEHALRLDLSLIHI